VVPSYVIMNSRQRLLAALRGQPTDRVPISTYELVGYNSQAFENKEPSYAALMQAIREKTDCLAMWNPASNEHFLGSAHPLEREVRTWREGDATVTRTVIHTPRGELAQTVKWLDGLYTPWVVEHWCKDLDDVDKALSVPYQPLTCDASDFARIQAEVGEHGIVMASLADPLLMAAELMEFGAFTIWAMTETEHFARTVSAMHERCMQNLRRMLAVNVVELYRICGPEYATPPYLPPRLFERFVTPYVTEMVNVIHEHGAQVRFHCHGKVGRVLDMILATGADALDPCEPPPDGDIALDELKRRTAGQMCLFGNLELKLLEHGTPDEVTAVVKACMDAAKAGGGYVIMPTAAPINVPLSVQTERNYLRFIDAALEYGAY
jgi:uroporphyrinogen-III decarboxylase